MIVLDLTPEEYRELRYALVLCMNNDDGSVFIDDGVLLRFGIDRVGLDQYRLREDNDHDNLTNTR